MIAILDVDSIIEDSCSTKKNQMPDMHKITQKHPTSTDEQHVV